MRRLIATFLFLFITAPVLGEAIFMRNGQILVGTITQQSEREVTAVIDGKTRVIPKSQIYRITFETEEEIKEKRRQYALERARALAIEKRQKEKEGLEKVRADYLAQQAKARAERAAYLREQVEKGNIEKPDEPISYYDFAWRSAVLPGWGHIGIGRRYWGYAYMGASALALINLADKWGPAYAAKAANESEVQQNILLAIASQNSPVSSSVKFLYFVEANHRASDSYRKKVDSYNYAVLTALTVYGVQLAHIIYNGFAWEEGLVVDNEDANQDRLFLNISSSPGTLNADTGLGLPPSAFSPNPGIKSELPGYASHDTSLQIGYQVRF